MGGDHVQAQLATPSGQVARPAWVWLGVALELFTTIGAIPVGLTFLTDPSGAAIGAKLSWIESSVFGNYFLPGLYLLLVNGFGMLALAAVTVRRHWIAPWLTGTLGVGLIIWIAVELIVLPETMFLTWIFLATGFALGFVALFWLRVTRQLVLW